MNPANGKPARSFLFFTFTVFIFSWFAASAHAVVDPPQNFGAVIVLGDAGSDTPSVLIAWSASSSVTDGKYVLERRSNEENSSFSQIGLFDLSETRYIDRGVFPGVSYRYRLALVTTEETSDYVTTDISVPLAGDFTGAPQTPQMVTAQPELDPFGIKVSWQSSDQSVTTFIVLRRTSEESEFNAIASVEGDQRAYLDTNMAPDTSYSYRIVAVNGEGISSNVSDTGSVSTDQIQLFLSARQNSPEDALNQLCLAGDETSTSVREACQSLVSADDALRGRILDQVRSRQLKGMANAAASSMKVQLRNVAHRLKNIRLQPRPVDVRRLTLQVGEFYIPLGSAIQSQLSSAAAPDEQPDYRGFGIFLSGQFDFGEKENTADEDGYDFETTGVTLGADYRFTNKLVAGSAVGYAVTDVEYDSAGSTLDTEAVTISLFANYFPADTLYVDLIGSIGTGKFEGERGITESGFEGTNRSETDSNLVLAALGSGWDANFGAFTFTPFVRVEWLKTEIDGFSEEGTIFALAVDDQEYESLKTNLGARLSYIVNAEFGVINPVLSIDWEHQYEDDEKVVEASFIELNTAEFDVSTDAPDRDHLNVGLTTTAILTSGWSGFFSYFTQLGQDDIRSHNLQLGIRLEF